jgi:hypothetical protein
VKLPCNYHYTKGPLRENSSKGLAIKGGEFEIKMILVIPRNDGKDWIRFDSIPFGPEKRQATQE